MISAFKRPLTRQEFREALKRGHGRALLHARESGLDEFRDEFIDACLHNKVFDTQCEDSRARWLGEFFVGTPDWLVQPLVAAYARGGNRKDQFQRAETLGLLGKRGCKRSREALYHGFRSTDWGLLGSDELIALDGAEALMWVAKQLTPMDEVQQWEMDHLIFSYDELYGEGEGMRALRDAQIPGWQEVFEQVSEPRRKPKGTPQKRNRCSAEEFVEAAFQGQVSIGFGRFWSSKASPEELQLVACALKRAKDSKTLESLLRCFFERGLPQFWPGLLELAEHDDSQVRWLTHWVLRHHHHPDIRSLGVRRLGENRTVEGEFKLFQSNFEKGDSKRILRALRRFPDIEEHIFHWALDDVLNIAMANPVKEALSLLIYVYEKTPCTSCRRKSVEAMRERGDLPDWILEECRCDCAFLPDPE